MQRDQRVDRQRVERARRRAAREQAGIGVVAQVLEQQEAGRGVLGQHSGRRKSERVQVARDAHEGAHVFLRRRRVHEHDASLRSLEAIIFAERGIAGDPPPRGLIPAMTLQELRDQRFTFAHVVPLSSGNALRPPGATVAAYAAPVTVLPAVPPAPG